MPAPRGERPADEPREDAAEDEEAARHRGEEPDDEDAEEDVLGRGDEQEDAAEREAEQQRVLDGTLITELKDGRTFALTPGMSYQAEDDPVNPHRSSTETGVKLFIVD